MATTVQEILNAAYAKSAKNRPGQLADPTSELLPLVYRQLRRYFLLAGRLNWRYYGKREVVAYSAATGGWPFPSDANLIHRLELLSGADYLPVIEVPADNRAADTARAAVYQLGRTFYGAGNAGDPTAGNLVFFYAKKPRALSALSGDPNGVLDPAWPEDFNELLVLSVAIQLARKQGGREGELAELAQELAAWEAQYLEHVTTLTQTMVDSGA